MDGLQANHHYLTQRHTSWSAIPCRTATLGHWLASRYEPKGAATLESSTLRPNLLLVNKRTRRPLPPQWPFPPRRDVAGRSFGDLVALHYCGAESWLWRCRCGGHVTAALKAVESGEVHDCGCREQRRVWRSRPGSPALKSGEVFGQLTTERYAGDGLWTCRCECGGEVTVSAGRLRTGKARSCGSCLIASTDRAA